MLPSAEGSGLMINAEAEMAKPEGVLTRTEPLPPLPAVAVICVAEFTVKELTGVPPMLTAVAPVKLAPVMVSTALSGQPDVGEKEKMAGAAADKKVKPALLPVPAGLVTDTWPEAPVLTMAVMRLPFTTVKDAAGVPPKLTAVAVAKLLPVMVMVVPE